MNLNQPDVSLGGDGDKAPLSLKAGVGYRPKWGTATAEVRRVKRLISQTDTDVLLGVERNIALANMGGLLLRGGYASGSRNYKSVTMGLSYLYSRFRLDYAFAFPITAIPGVGGSHRFGFSFRLGAAAAQLSKDYSNADLLEAFIYDSLATHVVLTRFALSRNIPADYKDQLMLVILRKYRLDDEGLKGVRMELRDLMRKYSDFMEWPHLRQALLRGVTESDRNDATNALEMLARNESKSGLMRLSVLPIETQRTDRIAGITLIALAELAAQAYRSEQLDVCIDNVRRMLELMPQDEVIIKAYRQLLAQRSSISEVLTVPEQEAPATLVAPKPTMETKEEPTAAQKQTSARDILAKAYGTSLGYYFTRKAAGGEARELQSLLEQMLVAYKDSGLDLSMIERELAEVKSAVAAEIPVLVKPEASQPKQPVEPATPTPAPAIEAVKETPAVAPATPVKTPAQPAVMPTMPARQPTTAPKPAEPKPAIRTHTPSTQGFVIAIPKELERAWRYYQDAAARDITDAEKVEILKEILKQFGEQSASRVNKELERIRRRAQ
jgi:hypothetical protein